MFQRCRCLPWSITGTASWVMSWTSTLFGLSASWLDVEMLWKCQGSRELKADISLCCPSNILEISWGVTQASIFYTPGRRRDTWVSINKGCCVNWAALNLLCRAHYHMLSDDAYLVTWPHNPPGQSVHHSYHIFWLFGQCGERWMINQGGMQMTRE